MARIDLSGTIYNVMDRAGKFSGNPANVGATNDAGEVLHKGPIKYPMMMYSPTGEFRVTDAGTKVKDVAGDVQVLGRHQELVSKIVRTKKEEDDARAEGWHDHPSKALAAGKAEGRYDLVVPAMSSAARIEDLEEQLARVNAELEAAKASQVAVPSKAGAKTG